MFMFPRDRMRRWASFGVRALRASCSGNKRKSAKDAEAVGSPRRLPRTRPCRLRASDSRAFVTDSACSKSRREPFAVPKLPDTIAKTEDNVPTGMEIWSGIRPMPIPKPTATSRTIASRPAGSRGDPLRRSHYPPRSSPPRLDTAEALGIPDPKPGEVGYFLGTRLVEDRYLHPDSAQPVGAVIVLRGIEERQAGHVHQANLPAPRRPLPATDPVCPPDQRDVGTYDSYATDLQIRSLPAGKLVMDGEVSAYDRSKIRQLGGGGVELKPPDGGSPTCCTNWGAMRSHLAGTLGRRRTCLSSIIRMPSWPTASL